MFCVDVQLLVQQRSLKMGNAFTKKTSSVHYFYSTFIQNEININIPFESNIEMKDIYSTLQHHCIQPLDATEDECRQVVTLITSKGFWSKHLYYHVNGKRIRNWIHVHDTYRNICQKMITTYTKSQNHKKIYMMLMTLQKKIGKHSCFENHYLFPFFEKEFPSCRGSLMTLRHQHEQSETDNWSEMWNTFGEELRLPFLRKIQKEIVIHLKIEEDTFVIPWLTLSKEQYIEYQSTLKFPYSWVY